MQAVLDLIEEKTGWVGTLELAGKDQDGVTRVHRRVDGRHCPRHLKSHMPEAASTPALTGTATTSSRIMP